MATYKKKYKAEGKNEQQQVDETQSTTAEVFNTLDDTASKSEQWIEKNNKALFYGLITIVAIVLAYLAYNKFVSEPAELNAANELAFPRKYFNDATAASSAQVDSLYNLGLEGADGKYGFVDIAAKYSGTKAGNLANYYAGVSYLQLKEYAKAIDYLGKFNSDDELLGPVALGAIGDAFADINQPAQALEYYEKAANKRDNEFTAPLFLEKAGLIAMDLKEFAKAEKFFTQLKDKYSKTEQGKNADKYIHAAKYANQ